MGIKHAGVIGWPIAHTRSPLIHRHWLVHHGVAGTYDKVAVEPDDLAAFVSSVRSGDYVGCNVTIPHKEAAAALCDRLTPAAQRLQAVNTLWTDGGELWGDSTDGAGFLGALDQEAQGWDAHLGRAVVVGAGGAGRAVVAALVARGFADVIVANRARERAVALTQRLGGTPLAFAALPGALEGADLLVNTTSAGMDGQPPLDLDLSALPPHAVVDDVYVPKETALLRAAAARGLRTVGGLGMLLHQAVPGFARWFGVTPEVTSALRALVEKDVEKGSAT